MQSKLAAINAVAHVNGAHMQGLVEVVYNMFQAILYSSIVYFMVGFSSSAGEPALFHSPASSLDVGGSGSHEPRQCVAYIVQHLGSVLNCL